MSDFSDEIRNLNGIIDELRRFVLAHHTEKEVVDWLTSHRTDGSNIPHLPLFQVEPPKHMLITEFSTLPRPTNLVQLLADAFNNVGKKETAE